MSTLAPQCINQPVQVTRSEVRYAGLLLLIVVLLGACGRAPVESDPASGDEVAANTLCDGSQDVRLYYRSKPLWGRMAEFDNVYSENGFEYLLVDGSCRFWAYSGFGSGGPFGRWNDVFTGTLDEDQAAQLSSELRWGALDELAGHFEDGGVAHGGVYQVSDGRSGIVSCEIECRDAQRQGVLEAARRWHEWMIDNGERVQGKLRGILAREPDDIQRSYDGAVDLPGELEPYVVDEPQLFGMAACPGLTVVFPEEGQTLLKELREEYRRGDHGFFRGFIPMVDEEGKSLQLHLRPAIAPEDEDGVIRFGFDSPVEEISSSGNPCPTGLD